MWYANNTLRFFNNLAIINNVKEFAKFEIPIHLRLNSKKRMCIIERTLILGN